MGAKTNGRPSWAAEVDAVPTGWPKKQAPATIEQKDEPKEDVNPEGLSDMEWMRRKMQSGTLDEKPFEQSDEEMQVDVPVDAPVEEPLNPTHASILSNGRLFVRNLVFSCTEDELQQHFSTFGEIEQVSLIFSIFHP